MDEDEIGVYSFLPWLREGISNNVVAPANPTAKRGKITVSLKIDGSGVDENPDLTSMVDKDIELYGPGDIVGIDSKAIIKSEPRHWITNFEPNYLPYIDFVDPDFLWRYTPSAANGKRLTPWLTLIVLREDEFKEGKNILNRPLAFISLDESLDLQTVLPPVDNLWAWGHVHVNKDIVSSDTNPVSENESAFMGKFNNTVSSNPDRAYCRLLSSRKLDENTGYHAFLIPTFETGRLAGLGFDPMASEEYGANTISWEHYTGRQEPMNFPVYHRWYFRTSEVGDFEYLVRLLEPRVADSRVGHRDIDVQDPGSNIAPIDDERLQGILRLGGALRFPVACLQGEQKEQYQTYENWDQPYPQQFQTELAAFINLADDYRHVSTQDAHQNSDLAIEEDEGDPDPLVTPPYYGHWHAMKNRVLKEDDGSDMAQNQNWIHELNLDPRWRTTANFGTNVIQKNQEAYMDAAWEQVGDVLEANKKLNYGRLAKLASQAWYRKHIVPDSIATASGSVTVLEPNIESMIFRTAPMHKRVLSGGKTLRHTMKHATLPHAMVSAPMRRVMRPRGRLAKKLSFKDDVRIDNLLERVNEQQVSPAPPREVPDGLLTHSQVSESTTPNYLSNWLIDLLKSNRWLLYVPLLLVMILILFLWLANVITSFASPAFLSVAVAGIGLYMLFKRILSDIEKSESILPDNQRPEVVDDFPSSPDFRITETGDRFRPGRGGSDSVEAERFKTALRHNFDFVTRSAEAGKEVPLVPLNLSTVVADTVSAINPEVTIPRYLLGQIQIPVRIIEALQEKFVDVMHYPVIDFPMYKPLLESGTDNFVPNLNLVEPNSISLLETNQKFIESYMVGLNHEFVRELRWREFPTDMRPTCFRQFWDISSVINKDELDDEGLRESLRDIPPLHRWSRYSSLGDHDHREAQGDKEEEVVLIIRGELLKKYPTAVIYAHKAEWALDENDERDLTKPREFAEGENVTEIIKTPLYSAKAEPDIYFFGFDISVLEAKGGSGEEDDDDAGWFFVIKERPGEPRFGLDVPGDADDFEVSNVAGWNDLSWSHVVENVSPGKYLTVTGPRSISVDSPSDPQPDDGEAHDAWQQQKEDSHLSWDSNMNSAELAYILYQVPVLVGVHAAEMLPDECSHEDEDES
jgi:hypothetical protein